MSIFSNLFGRNTDNIRVERDNRGNYSYWLDNNIDGCSKDYLNWSFEHPILFSILALRAKMVSQVQFKHIDEKGEEVKNSDVLKLLAQPNYFQSQQDFIYQLVYFLGATGNNYTYTPTATKLMLPSQIYNLVPNQIEWDKVNKLSQFIKSEKEFKDFSKRKINYKLDGKDTPIELANLIPMYDVANGLTAESWFKSPSRVKAIEKNLLNIEELLKSKNINAKMSQKYLAVSDDGYNGATAPMQEADKRSVKGILSKESLHVTNGKVSVGHLVENLKNLALDPQISQEAQICLLAFGLNNDVLNFFAGGSSTFENQEKGEIRAYQNEIQGIADNIANSFTAGLNIKGKLVATFDHLPIMQTILADKVDSFKLQQEAIKIALENGTITDKEAIEMTKQYLNRIKL